MKKIGQSECPDMIGDMIGRSNNEAQRLERKITNNVIIIYSFKCFAFLGDFTTLKPLGFIVTYSVLILFIKMLRISRRFYIAQATGLHCHILGISYCL